MDRFAKFLSVNKLKKKEIAAYLGVSNAFITQLCNGSRTLPADKLALIKANEEWDTSMLTPKSKYIVADGLLEGVGLAREKSAEELLVSYLQDKIADQDRVIRELYKEIGMLQAKLDLARKGETASDATGSSDADAV